MKLSAFFAVPLLLAFGDGTFVKTPDAPASSTQGAAEQEPGQPPMTQRQKDEMRAQIMMARKDYQEAAVAYQKILEQEPNNVEALNQVGIAYQQLHQDDLARRFYKRALKVDGKSLPALNNLGSLEHGAGRYGKAIKYYKKAIKTGGGGLADVYANMGSAYCSIKQIPLAMDAFSKALAIDPDVFERRGGAGAIVQQRSDTDQATLHFLMAKSYAKLGDAEHAARYLKLARDSGYKDFMAAEKDPDFARVIKDPQVQDVLKRRPAYEAEQGKPVTN